MDCDKCGGKHKNHMFRRFTWSIKTAKNAKPKTFVSRIRLLWHDFILHTLLNKGTERCQDCGRDYAWYNVSNETWFKVMGGPSGLLCYYCFLKRY